MKVKLIAFIVVLTLITGIGAAAACKKNVKPVSKTQSIKNVAETDPWGPGMVDPVIAETDPWGPGAPIKA